MVENNDIDPRSLNRIDLSERGRSTINRDEQFRIVLAETARNSFRAETVALFHSERQKKCRLVSVGTQNFGQKRKGGYAVDIVIAK